MSQVVNEYTPKTLRDEIISQLCRVINETEESEWLQADLMEDDNTFQNDFIESVADDIIKLFDKHK